MVVVTLYVVVVLLFFFFQAEDGIRDDLVTGVQTCALPIYHPVRVVTIPVGYGDGYFRALSNVAQVIIRGKKYPVVGRVCMDQIMVNLESDSAYNGDEVVLLGERGREIITCEDLAEWAGTIPYEILTNINTRVPRVYL